MRRRGKTVDLSLRISCVDDLFCAPDPRLFSRTGRLQSGIDELMAQLRVERLPVPVRTRIALFGQAPVDEARLHQSVQQYCSLRLRDLELELRAHRREERQSLLVGGLLFLLGILLSAEFTQSFWPVEVQTLLGDGIFLVLAWVGLWYPLDYFVFGRRLLLRDRRVLHAIRSMEITVRSEQLAGDLTDWPLVGSPQDRHRDG